MIMQVKNQRLNLVSTYIPNEILQQLLYKMQEFAASIMLASKNVCNPGAFLFRYHFTKKAETFPMTVAKI